MYVGVWVYVFAVSVYVVCFMCGMCMCGVHMNDVRGTYVVCMHVLMVYSAGMCMCMRCVCGMWCVCMCVPCMWCICECVWCMWVYVCMCISGMYMYVGCGGMYACVYVCVFVYV